MWPNVIGGGSTTLQDERRPVDDGARGPAPDAEGKRCRPALAESTVGPQCGRFANRTGSRRQAAGGRRQLGANCRMVERTAGSRR